MTKVKENPNTLLFQKQKKAAIVVLDEMFINPIDRPDYVFDGNGCKVISTYSVLKDILLIDKQALEYQKYYDILKSYQDKIDSKRDSTYNYALPVENDFEFVIHKGRGFNNWYVFISIHNGHDIMDGNYSDMKCFKLNIDANDNFTSYFDLTDDGELITRPY